MISVTPIHGRPLCYLVGSRKGEAQYLCDLTQFNGNGHCTCNDFCCRVVANMKKPHELLTDDTLCFHLRRAHLHLMQGVLEEILAQ